MSYYFSFFVKLYQLINLFIVHTKINFLCSQTTRKSFRKTIYMPSEKEKPLTNQLQEKQRFVYLL